MTTSIIQTQGLTKRFGDFCAVDRLTIRVERGSIFAFLGANGSGKSTTIRMLIGLLEPTAGTVEVDGVDVIRHPRRVRDRIGYMGQRVSLYVGLTLRENVEFYGGLYGLEGDALERRWGALRERFSLLEAERDRTEDFPAGIRQRAGLALATLHEPRLLFLDEPTAGVDVHNRELFWELIREESTAGVTVFVTTHFLEEAEWCDRVCLIASGRLIADAPPEELRGRFGDGYRVHVEAPTPESRVRVQSALGDFGERARPSDGGLELLLPELDPDVLVRLDRLSEEERSLAIRIEPTSMSEIFRRLLREDTPT